MKAINIKNQAMVTKAVNWLVKHNEANRQRDLASDNNERDNDDECATWRKFNRLCEKTFDKYEECTSELPYREVKQIETSELY
tara:strand:+ start:1112 stop:1360 length:249 start_codon:yes stop_codon:yes gene_type:complete